jgi:hypothetical protein
MIAEPVWPDPMTVDGTKRTYRTRRLMSVSGGRTEVGFRDRQVRC